MDPVSLNLILYIFLGGQEFSFANLINDSPEFILIDLNSTHLFRFNPTTNETRRVNYGSGKKEIMYFEADSSWNYVCWAEARLEVDRGAETLYCVTPLANISWPSIGETQSMSIDTLAGNVYWINKRDSVCELGVTSLRSGGKAILLSENAVLLSAIALDADEGFMGFISEFTGFKKRGDRSLERSNMDGASSQPPLRLEESRQMTAIVLDRKRKEVFALASKCIARVGYEGSTWEYLIPVEFQNFHRVSLLGWNERYYYYFVTPNDRMNAYELIGNSMTQKPDVLLPQSCKHVSLAQAVVSGRRENPCENSPCDAVCLLSPKSFTCACPPQFDVSSPNGTRCQLRSHFLMYSTRREIFSMTFQENNSLSSPLIFKVGYDPNIAYIQAYKETLYFASNHDAVIKSVPFLTDNMTEVAHLKSIGISGLAIDPSGGNLFWTHEGSFSIEVIGLTPGKRFRKVLTSENVYAPRGLTIDAREGILFWTDLSGPFESSGRLLRMGLDGSEKRVIMEGMERISSQVFASEGWLYWWKEEGIFRSTYQGENEKLVITYPNKMVSRPPVHWALDVYKDMVYWEDPEKKAIYRSGINSTKKKIEAVVEKVGPLLMDFKIVKPDEEMRGNPCREEGNGCEQLCLFNGDVGKASHCACANDFILALDGKTCESRGDFNYGVLMRNIAIFSIAGLAVGIVFVFGGIRYYQRSLRWMSEEEYREIMKGKEFIHAVWGHEIALSEELPDNHILSLQNIKVGDEMLGMGRFGVVRKGTLTFQGTTILAAFKSPREHKDDGSPLDFETKKEKSRVLIAEFKIMSYIEKQSHGNIVSFYGVECTRMNYGDITICMELAEGSLESYMQCNHSRLKNELVDGKVGRMLNWCTDVVKGMKHLGELKIIHEDLGPSNVLLFNSARMAKVADFGLARQLCDSKYIKLKSEEGLSWEHLAPETWMELESRPEGRFSHAADVWSFGLLVWMVFSPGRSPFPPSEDALSHKDVWRRKCRCAESSIGELLDKTDSTEPGINQIILGCLEKEPGKRPAFGQLLEFFQPLTANANAGREGSNEPEVHYVALEHMDGEGSDSDARSERECIL